MFFSDDYLSDTEKINRVYKMLRAERRARWFGFFIKLSILGGIIYGFHYLGLPENASKKEGIMTAIETRTSELILPMVGSMVKSLTQDLGEPGLINISSPTTTTTTGATGNKVNRKNIPSGSSTASPINITPEMIKAVQDFMKK